MSIDKISSLVQNQFPDFYKEEGPQFLAFIQAYYEYLEEQGKLTDSVRNLKSYSDVNTTLDEYLEYFINTFLPSVPFEVFADKRIMIKYIREFNRSRGTLASYRLLFRTLYNEEIDVEFPADQILKVSDGDWRLDRYLVSSYDPATYQFIGKTIKGQESKSEALVEDIVRKNIRGRDLMQIIVSNVRGAFAHLEPIRLLSDQTGVGHAPLIESGIANTEIISGGGEYRVGDILDLVSNDLGEFAKVAVTKVQNFGGVLTFRIVQGGSGYTPSTDPDGSVITFTGGDGAEPASFILGPGDIVDRFAISINTDLIGANTVYGSKSPSVLSKDGVSRQMITFANVELSSVDYGFREQDQTGELDFRDHENALLNIANTVELSVGDSLYGSTSGANAIITDVVTLTAGDTVLKIDSHKRFTDTENVTIDTDSGPVIGTVTEFQSNTIGFHPMQIGILSGETISEGDEIVGLISNTFGVVKHLGQTFAGAYTPDSGPNRDLINLRVTANNTANLTSQLDNGPMSSFLEDEGIRKVDSSTEIGNVVFTTSNTEIENIYTKLEDAFNFEATTFGSIVNLSLPVGGEGFSQAPTIDIIENDIAVLGIGEQYLTIQSDDVNWDSANSSFLGPDTNDRFVQTSTGASGDVKGGKDSPQPAVIQHPNGTYETVVRVWQDFLQREPGNVTFANNQTVTLNIYDSSYTPGTIDTRSVSDTATGKIVFVEDRGVLGKNANVISTVGANGSITQVRVLDSGFSYKNGEVVIVETTNRDQATSATLRLDVRDVANSEGYYASTRSHLDSLRGFIQDSNFYQEYSYQIVSPVSLDRYKEYALNLVHPAGQALFGKFRSQSNTNIDVEVTSNNSVQKYAGTVELTEGSFDVVGTDTEFETNFANGDLIIVEYADRSFYSIPINTITSDTEANLTIAWANSNIASANVYYRSGSI
jgi:hypothetical protein